MAKLWIMGELWCFLSVGSYFFAFVPQQLVIGVRNSWSRKNVTFSTQKMDNLQTCRSWYVSVSVWLVGRAPTSRFTWCHHVEKECNTHSFVIVHLTYKGGRSGSPDMGIRRYGPHPSYVSRELFKSTVGCIFRWKAKHPPFRLLLLIENRCCWMQNPANLSGQGIWWRIIAYYPLLAFISEGLRTMVYQQKYVLKHWMSALLSTHVIPCRTESKWEDSSSNKAVTCNAFSSTPLKAKFTAGKLNKHYAYNDNSFLQTQVLIHADAPWYSASESTTII